MLGQGTKSRDKKTIVRATAAQAVEQRDVSAAVEPSVHSRGIRHGRYVNSFGGSPSLPFLAALSRENWLGEGQYEG